MHDPPVFIYTLVGFIASSDSLHQFTLSLSLSLSVHSMRKHAANLLIILYCLLPVLFILTESRTHPGDLQVLKDLRNGVHPRSITPGSCLSSWQFSMDPCDHIFTRRFTCGFRCDLVVHNLARITEITLDPAGYSGSLNSTTWNLPYLQTLDLSDNSFRDSIPDSLSNLTRVRRLILSSNLLSGKLPNSLGSLTHLEELYLDNNHLHGHIPPSFNNLVSLKRLELQQNHLSGELPLLSSLSTLSFLDASNNELTGRIPPSLPPSLIELSIRNNMMDGNIPDDVGRLVFLQVLDLSYNKLSGMILSLLFDHPSLQQLSLSNNNFTFLQMPKNMGFTSNLIALDLSYNKLRGFLPSFMVYMPKLTALSLEHNMFTGMIPSQYALKAVVVPEKGTSSFQRLLLGGNYLFGPIPGALMGLKPGNANVSLVDNCLYRCPDIFFFCQGGDQKSGVDCKSFGPVIP